MPKITVDDVDYNTEDLTDNGKAQLASLQFLEVQMRKLQNEISVYQTARNSYIAALKADFRSGNLRVIAGQRNATLHRISHGCPIASPNKKWNGYQKCKSF